MQWQSEKVIRMSPDNICQSPMLQRPGYQEEQISKQLIKLLQKIPPKKFLQKNPSKKFLKKSKKFPNNFSKNSQYFENIQFPTSHLEAFGLVLLIKDDT